MKFRTTIYKTTSLLFLVLILFSDVIYGQETINDTIIKIENYQKLADQSISSQNFEDAIIQLNAANELAFVYADSTALSNVQVAIAEIHYFLMDYSKAAEVANDAINLLENQNNPKTLAKAYGLYGLILTRTGDYIKSEKYLKKADDIFIEFSDDENRANIILGLALLNLKNGNLKVALNYLDAVIPMYNSSQTRYQKATAYINKAEALLLLYNGSQINEAKEALVQADQIKAGKNYAMLEIHTLRVRQMIAEIENDLSKALFFSKKYQALNDSILMRNLKAISRGAEIQTLKNAKEMIAQQKTVLEKQKRAIDFTKMGTGLSVALIVILSLLTLSLYKNNNLRAKANELLQDKNNELLLAKEKAEKASLAKAQFLSTITHELRTPLYAVTGLTHLLLEENPLPQQKEHLNSLKFSGEYLLSLINNILDLNKLEANKVEMEKTSFSLKKRIKDVLVALKKSADDRKNSLVLEFDSNIPSKLAGDPLKLSQILINLIGNSVKFTQNGVVTVRIKLLERVNNKAILHFEIEDNGVGISAKKQKTIFETFSQGSLQINRKFGGTGLGLSIVKNLLELMNSKIHLESQLGQGSKFSFKINFDVAEEVDKTTKSDKAEAKAINIAALENKNILVVEDNKINQMITKKILEKNNMVCMVADNGLDAIKLVEENNFDVVLMDIHMPGISGIEATKKIRKFNKELPIIALTAVTIDENLDEFYRAGFSEIIPKPFKIEEFFEKIYRSIENKNISLEG